MVTELWNHLWQSTLSVYVVWCVSLLVRRSRADVRHTLWLSASLKFLVPFGVLVALGRLLPLGAATPRFEETLTVSVLAERLSLEALEPRIFLIGRSATDRAAAEGMLSPTMAVLLGIWLTGTLSVAGRWLWQWRRVSLAVRAAKPLTEGREIQALRNVEIAARSLRRCQMRQCEGAFEPGVVGISRPVILWPRGLSERLSDAQIESVLAHELAHVGRHDNAKVLLHMLVQAVFWFHPLVWWIGAKLVDERERACDEHVVRQGREREVYAQSILVTCTFVVESLVPCVSGVTGADLKRRIEAIMRGQPGRPLTRLQRLVLACAAIAAIATPVAVGARSAPRPFLKRITLVRGDRVGFMPITLSQDPATRPAFEAASVRENTSGDVAVRINIQPGGRLVATNYPLRALIRTAFQLQDDQIVGVPNALGSRRFDIVAKAPGDLAPTRPGVVGPLMLMLQSLLEERFAARVHRETRDLPAYALVPARRDGRLGPKLAVPATDCEALMQRMRAGGPPPPRPAAGDRPVCGSRVVPGRILAGGFTLSELARVLSDQMGRAVVDQTGLAGAYDLDISYTPDQGLGSAAGAADPVAVDQNAPALTTALQEQLGLKLEPTRAPIDVLVVDRIAMPTLD